MRQTLPNRAKMGLSVQNIRCFGMKVGAPRLRAPPGLAALAPCRGQMATCGNITGAPDDGCLSTTPTAESLRRGPTGMGAEGALSKIPTAVFGKQSSTLIDGQYVIEQYVGRL